MQFCGELEKKGQQDFALFKSIFLRNPSLSNTRWVLVKTHNQEGNTENRLHRNGYRWEGITVICITYVQFEFLDSNFCLRSILIVKIAIFQEIAQIHIFTKITIFKSTIGTRRIKCFSPINFMAETYNEYTFPFLPVVNR